MTCKDYKWGDMFSEHEQTEEKVLAEKYILSVQSNEDIHIQDQKYWDYYNHVMELRSVDGNLFDLINDIHEKQRRKDLEGELDDD